MFWHNAPSRLRGEISRVGLLPGRDGFVYLFDTKSEARSWDYDYGDVYRVDVEGYEVEQDPHPDASSGMWRFRGKIKAALVSLDHRSNPSRPLSRPRTKPRSEANNNECALIAISELTDTPLSKTREVAATMPSHGYANLAEKITRKGMVWPEVENVVLKMGWLFFAIPMPHTEGVRKPTLEESELLMLPQNSDGWVTVGRLVPMMPHQRLLIATKIQQGYHAVSWHPEKGYIDWAEGAPYAVRLDGTEVALVRETIGNRTAIWRLPPDVNVREVKPRVYRREARTFRVSHPSRRVLWCGVLLKPGTTLHARHERNDLLLRDLIGPKWRAWAKEQGVIENL